MREHEYYVYILSSNSRRLYVGVTNSLMTRVRQHKRANNPNSFTARYGINRLVYFERFQYVQDAIGRETEIKGWLRMKKIALIVKHNPTWRDLSEDWGGSRLCSMSRRCAAQRHWGAAQKKCEDSSLRSE